MPNALPKPDNSLTPKQQRFVDAYLANNGNTTRVSANLAAVGNTTDFLQLRSEQLKTFMSRLSGVFVGTVIFEAKRPGEAPAAATQIDSLAAPALKVGHLDGEWDVRARMTAFTSGTAVAEISA